MGQTHRYPSLSRLPRTGLSLLEIIVALAVLAGSAVVLSQMIDIGSRPAERAAQIAEAQTVAHNLLHELLIQERPLTTNETPEPIDLWSPYDYTVLVEPVGIGQLLSVTVEIYRRQDATPEAMLEPLVQPVGERSGVDQLDRVADFRLTRWMRRPRATDETTLSDETDSLFWTQSELIQ